MKTPIHTFAKDNIATGTVLAAMFFAIMGAFVDTHDARANESALLSIQWLETITVTASRSETVLLDAIVVTAARDTGAHTKAD